MKDIKFSVVISCFNLGSTISNAISSIKKQTFANYECLIVDDCSSDNTLDFIRQAIGNDKRFSIIRHEKNESLYMTRKTGVKNSCGEYLIFLDGDDTLCENALEEISKKIRASDESLEVIEFGYNIWPNNEKYLPPKFDSNNSRFNNYLNNIISTVWNKVYNLMFLKNIFKDLPDEYINMAEDVFLSVIIAYNTKFYQAHNYCMTNYFVGNGMSTKLSSLKDNEKFLNSIVKICDLLKAFFISKEPNNADKYVDIVRKKLIANYIDTCEKRTISDSINESLALLFKYFSNTELLELYPIFLVSPSNIKNIIKLFGRKRILLEVLKFKK